MKRFKCSRYLKSVLLWLVFIVFGKEFPYIHNVDERDGILN